MCNVNCDHSAHCVNILIALVSKDQKREASTNFE